MSNNPNTPVNSGNNSTNSNNANNNNNNQSEEVDLIVFFNLIGNGIQKVINFFGSLFIGLYAFFIACIKVIFVNIKIIAIVVIVALAIGFTLDKVKDQVYYSEMFVVPNFESKYVLIENINYFNSLIKLKDTEELSQQFNITAKESEALVEFEIEAAPESKNEQLKEFGLFMKDLDSVTRSKVDYEIYLDNRDLYSAEMFLLRARTKNNKLFIKLEKGLSQSINNDYSDLKKQERDSVLRLEKENLEVSLAAIRKIKDTYLSVLEKESEKTSVSSNLGNALGLQVEKTQTKEDELLAQEIATLHQLSEIKRELVLKNTIFDKVSSFREKGIVENIWYKKYKIIVPLFALIVLGFFSALFTFYKHVIRYN
ncbi:hypothetical protein ES677_04665 [Bizionia gelidisalsuginis]|uniref:Polysaccharide chain length determinant N-terminal domain-containing protein n=1 Tax=Bizionia gelidisalsuginis TaxID=291188 RepID=A0ABY3MCL0_9FLAO|nr:hypothetical protein [Bizionia gelidisalsuginis]TYC15638.1 hypothetical protein ES677_04665 [Bizionia gelidisalsuginis]